MSKILNYKYNAWINCIHHIIAGLGLHQFSRRSHLVIAYKYTKSVHVSLLATLFVFKATSVLFLRYMSRHIKRWCPTVYPKKYAHGFVVLCFVVIIQSFIMNSHEVFIHIHQGCFAGTGAIVRLPQCQWSKPDEYGKISQCITTKKHSKAKTVCIFLGIYCTCVNCCFSKA